MRPIDYAIKLIVAYNMDKDYFGELSEDLYYNDDDIFVKEVLNILETEDKDVYTNHLSIVSVLNEY